MKNTAVGIVISHVVGKYNNNLNFFILFWLIKYKKFNTWYELCVGSIVNINMNRGNWHKHNLTFSCKIVNRHKKGRGFKKQLYSEIQQKELSLFNNLSECLKKIMCLYTSGRIRFNKISICYKKNDNITYIKILFNLKCCIEIEYYNYQYIRTTSYIVDLTNKILKFNSDKDLQSLILRNNLNEKVDISKSQFYNPKILNTINELVDIWYQTDKNIITSYQESITRINNLTIETNKLINKTNKFKECLIELFEKNIYNIINSYCIIYKNIIL